MDKTILTTSHKEHLLPINSSSLVNSHVLRDELNVSDKVFMGSFDIRQNELLKFHSCLLRFVFFLIWHFSYSRFAALGDSVFNRTKIPSHNLTIDRTSHDDSRILWVELESSDLDRRLKNVVESNDMWVFEIENQDVGIKRNAEKINSVFVCLKMLNKRNSDKMFLGWMETNARHCFALAVLLLEVCPWNNIYIGILSACCSIFISEHLKVVLEHIDDFIGLKSFFNSVLHAVNELVELFV